MGADAKFYFPFSDLWDNTGLHIFQRTKNSYFANTREISLSYICDKRVLYFTKKTAYVFCISIFVLFINITEQVQTVTQVTYQLERLFSHSRIQPKLSQYHKFLDLSCRLLLSDPLLMYYRRKKFALIVFFTCPPKFICKTILIFVWLLNQEAE